MTCSLSTWAIPLTEPLAHLPMRFTGGSSDAPQSATEFSLPYYKIINRLSANFALTADMCLDFWPVILNVKKCFLAALQIFTAHLFIATAILKYFEHSKKSVCRRITCTFSRRKSVI